MDGSLDNIPLLRLALTLLPVLAVVAILAHWSLQAGRAGYALLRMLAQLLLVGYVLTFIFSSHSAWPVLLVLAVMILASSWIALGTVPEQRRRLLGLALASIGLCGTAVLALVAGPVLQLEPWFRPHSVIPLAGMIYASAMNSVSLAAERVRAEALRGEPWPQVRHRAMHTAMIPMINSLFAVGLVALPGMMTGQILSGVSPLVAARYQIMVMCMLFGATGLATAMFLWLGRRHFVTNPPG